MALDAFEVFKLIAEKDSGSPSLFSTFSVRKSKRAMPCAKTIGNGGITLLLLINQTEPHLNIACCGVLCGLLKQATRKYVRKLPMGVLLFPNCEKLVEAVLVKLLHVSLRMFGAILP